MVCPHCGQGLAAISAEGRLRGLRCPAGHRFDAAKQGYVNLTAGQRLKLTPDTAEMIMARERIQQAGVFDALSSALAETLTGEDQVIADCGAGTGHYLHRLLNESPGGRGIALDISPAGLRRAAKHPRTLALVWDLWQPLPVGSESVSSVLNVFAPRNPAEYARILTPGGQAVVVIPLAEHLVQLQQHGLIAQQPDKRRHLQDQMAPHLGRPTQAQEVRAEVPVSPETAADLIRMGPAGHHRSQEEVLDAVGASGIRTVTVAAEVLIWQKVPG
ncbi:rRNA (guanine-N1)-methyltransferase [Nesterenkonia populi]